ncbi:hypothetical protein O3M35_003912 [Rhynocoris fuscipes]|uniref:ANKLE2 third alpha/beta domain-containing protein n=1 Tax=Rhynocoris fuscipes TaxID=488301 RepID=A0AAW1CHT2_9HEMI
MSPAKEIGTIKDKRTTESLVNLELIVDEMVAENFVSSNKAEPNNVFYSIYIPSGNQQSPEEENIYVNKTDALNFLKQHKKARLKTFTSRIDALYFTKFGDVSPTNPLTSLNTPSKSPEPQAQSHEKTAYKAPKVQDMIKFRKAIECGYIKEVIKLVEENPRYLVSSGDTPSILQEGSRYNALHIASRNNVPAVASYILELISSAKLIHMIYGSNEYDQHTKKAEVLLDLYLNTPDKSLNETPLHFASKVGAIDVVQVLILYPQCDRYRRNKFGLTPLDVVCSRASGDFLRIKQAIISALNENYYIPVLRSNDSSIQPTIGDPITVSDDPNLSINSSPLSPNVRVHALAGPMSEERAKMFRKVWKSPSAVSCTSYFKTRPSLYDFEKGLERIGRVLASEFNVQWKEYWSFLDTFIDLKSEEGLQMLENYLKERCFKTSPNKNIPTRVCTEQTTFLQRLLPPELGPNPPIGLPAFCLENFLKIIAKRIYIAISRVQSIQNEVHHLQNFLISCYNDERFDSVELYKVHHRISQLIETNFETSIERSNFIEKVIAVRKLLYYDILHGDVTPGKDRILIRRASLCIFQFLLFNKDINLHEGNENLPQNSLIKCDRCHCGSLIKGRPRRQIKKKLIFSSDVDNVSADVGKISISDSPNEGILETESFVNKPQTDAISTNDANTDSDIDNVSANFNKLSLADQPVEGVQEIESLENYSEADSASSNDANSDSDDYFTPPSTPVPAKFNMCSSSEEDDEYFEAQWGYDVFLAGDGVSKLDASVLQAISSVQIDVEKYPFIHFWKYSCEKLSKHFKQESWPTPNIKIGPSSMFLKDILSPTRFR